MPMRQSRDYSKSRRAPKPLNRAVLEELALAYVARFSTTQGKLNAYLRRKLRERGWEDEQREDGEAAVEAIVARFVAAGYIDDAAWAKSKSESLLRRGYGVRRVAQALDAAGVDSDSRAEVRPGIQAQRRAALAFLRKRRFGPFGLAEPDRAVREKQIAAMLRAGHALDSARELVNAISIDAAESWADQVEDDV